MVKKITFKDLFVKEVDLGEKMVLKRAEKVIKICEINKRMRYCLANNGRKT